MWLGYMLTRISDPRGGTRARTNACCLATPEPEPPPLIDKVYPTGLPEGSGFFTEPQNH